MSLSLIPHIPNTTLHFSSTVSFSAKAIVQYLVGALAFHRSSQLH